MTTDLLTLSLFTHRTRESKISRGNSKLETAILRSDVPIKTNELEQITVNGNHGIWLNKSESDDWKGSIPISEYPINIDNDPEIIKKETNVKIEYIQELAVRYLRPPSLPSPGDIIIREEEQIAVAPAPPLIIRQQPARPATPEPLVIRELPPKAPSPLGVKHIIVSGKKLPPPPRKVVIERLAKLPVKPQPIIIERWLPYKAQRRRVVYEKKNDQAALTKPKNVIIQWEAPKVTVKQEVKYLGIINANPLEYCQRYCGKLKKQPESHQELSFKLDYYQSHEQLKEELDKESFCETKLRKAKEEWSIKPGPKSYQDQMFFRKVFAKLDKDSTGEITIDEALGVFEKISYSLNKHLKKQTYSIKALFDKVDENNDGLINFDEFQYALNLFFLSQ